MSHFYFTSANPRLPFAGESREDLKRVQPTVPSFPPKELGLPPGDLQSLPYIILASIHIAPMAPSGGESEIHIDFLQVYIDALRPSRGETPVHIVFREFYIDGTLPHHSWEPGSTYGNGNYIDESENYMDGTPGVASPALFHMESRRFHMGESRNSALRQGINAGGT